MKERIVAKCWYCLILMLLVTTSIVENLDAQKSPANPDTQPSEVAREAQGQKKSNLVEEWVRKNPLVILLWGILAPVIVWLLKDIIRKRMMEDIKPKFTQALTRVLTRFGAYEALLKRYLQTQQKKLKSLT